MAAALGAAASVVVQAVATEGARRLTAAAPRIAAAVTNRFVGTQEPPPPPPPSPYATCAIFAAIALIALIGAQALTCGVFGLCDFAPLNALGNVGSIALIAGGGFVLLAECVVLSVITCRQSTPPSTEKTS